MSRKPKLSPEQAEQLRERREQGASLSELESEFLCSEGVVLRALRRLGPYSNRGPSDTRALDQEQVEALRAKKALGMTYNQLAVEFGVSPATVEKAIKAMPPYHDN